jgi:hypothetical protein
MSRILVLGVVLLALGSAPASAKKTLDVDSFLEQQRVIRNDIESGRKHRDMDNETKERLFLAQDRMFGLLEGRGSIDDLEQDELIELYNAQGTVNALLTDSELERDVCRRVTTVGTHRVGIACYSVREWRRIRETEESMMLAPRICMPGMAPVGADPCNQGD